nr:undecaprenyl-phosphate glucose phosphotransferase [Pontibacter liquoris]
MNVIVDYFLLNLTLYIAFLIKDPDAQLMDIYDYRLIILLLNLSWFYCSSIFEIYNYILKRDALPTLTANIASLGLLVSISVVLKVALPQISISKTSLLVFCVLFPIITLSWRFLFLLLRKYRKQFWLDNKIVIVGSGTTGLDLYHYILSNPQLDYDIVGIFDDNSSLLPASISCLGKVDECISYAIRHKVHEIYCALPASESNKIEMLLQEADKQMIRFRLVPDMNGAFHHKYLVELFGYMPVLKPRLEPLENKANEMTKRLFDILFSSLVIVFLLSWFVPLLAIIIKLDSKGPVFFRQLRSGKDNQPFHCLKFRSMALNTDADALQACKGDMRVTRVGRFIRKTSIDELPQFFNVFVGDMSVVGPRPHMLKHTQDYSQVINNYMVRHFLTPGITGWAQVNGFRGETKETIAMLNRVQADLWYLENWTLFLDLKIVILTLWQVFKRNENAY